MAAGWLNSASRPGQPRPGLDSAMIAVCVNERPTGYRGLCARQLLLRGVVKWLSLIDDMNGQILNRFVSHDFECAVRYIATVDAGRTCWEGDLLAIWKLDHTAFHYIK